MRPFLISLFAILAFSAINTSALAQGKDNTFIVGDAVQMTAEVIKINKKKTKVTLQGKNGKTKVIKLPEQLKDKDKIEVGDILDIEIVYGLVIELAKPGELEGEKILTEVRYNKKGEKPTTVQIESVDVVAKIQSLDLETRTVTLVGDKGHTVNMIADSSVKNFDTLKVGDEVHARFTEEFAVGFVSRKK